MYVIEGYPENGGMLFQWDDFKSRQDAINQASRAANNKLCKRAFVYQINNGKRRLIYIGEIPSPPTIGD